jgi:serine/threonine-protein kinase
MLAKEFSEACPKLQESYRLVPGAGTLLNLALCHEAEGRTATAWAEFVEARGLARRDGRADRERIANEHIAAIEPTLSKLTVVVAPGSDLPDLRVTIDGVELGRAVWGTAVPVDPGRRLIEARAKGRPAWSESIEFEGSGDAKSVSIVMGAASEATAAPATPPPEFPPRAPPAALPHAAPERSAPPTRDSVEAGGGTQRTLAWVVTGVGVAGIGVGAYFGIRAISKWSESNDECPRNDACSPDGAQAAADAGKFADFSTAAFTLGAVCLGVGVWLHVSAEPEAARGVWIGPTLGSRAAGGALGGRF